MTAYERFYAWRAAHHLALELYRATDTRPRPESKRGAREFRRFLDIALGSLGELSYLLRFSRDDGLLTEASWLTLKAPRPGGSADPGSLPGRVQRHGRSAMITP